MTGFKQLQSLNGHPQKTFDRYQTTHSSGKFLHQVSNRFVSTLDNLWHWDGEDFAHHANQIEN